MERLAPFSTKYPSILVLVALIGLAALLWLPVGFESGVTGDAWIYSMQVNQGDIFAHALPIRLFIPVPWLIAFAVTPGSFLGITLITFMLLVGKSWFLFLITRRLTSNERFAFTVAVIYLFLPVDTGIFYLGALAVHFSAFCYLVAVFCFLEYWQKRRMLPILVMAIAQLLACGIYEVVFVFAAITPLILILETKHVTGQVIRSAILWYIVPLLAGLWYIGIVLAFPRAIQYQAGIAQVDRSLGVMLRSLLRTIQHHFWDGWAITNTNFLPAAISAALIVALLMLIWHKTTKAPSLWNVPVGGAILIAGIVLYLPTSLRDETLRTFYFSGIGAALVIAVIVERIHWRMLNAVVIALLVGTGCLSLLSQHREYIEQSRQQRAILSEMTEVLPQLKSGTGVVFIDRSGELLQVIGSPLYMEYMLPLVYGDFSLTGTLCQPEQVGSQETDRCYFGPASFNASGVRRQVRVTYDSLVVVDYTNDGYQVRTTLDGIQNYAPEERLLPPDPNLATRLRRLFGE